MAIPCCAAHCLSRPGAAGELRARAEAAASQIAGMGPVVLTRSNATVGAVWLEKSASAALWLVFALVTSSAPLGACAGEQFIVNAVVEHTRTSQAGTAEFAGVVPDKR